MNFEDYIKDIGDNIDYKANSFIDIGNGLLLTNKEINVLNNYDVIYENCNNLKELIYIIGDKLDEYDYPDDLVEIADTISERDYYINTEK